MSAQLGFPLLSTAVPSAASAGAPALPSGAQHSAGDFASLLEATCGAQPPQTPTMPHEMPRVGDRSEAAAPDVAARDVKADRDRDDEKQEHRSPIGMLPEQLLAVVLAAPAPALPVSAVAPQVAAPRGAGPAIDPSAIPPPSGWAENNPQAVLTRADVQQTQEPKRPLDPATSMVHEDVDGVSAPAAPSAAIDAPSTAKPLATATETLAASASAAAPAPAAAPASALDPARGRAAATSLGPAPVAPSAPLTDAALLAAVAPPRPPMPAAGLSPARAPTSKPSSAAASALAGANASTTTRAVVPAPTVDPLSPPGAPHVARAGDERTLAGPTTTLGEVRRGDATVAQPTRGRAAVDSASATRSNGHAASTPDRTTPDAAGAVDEVGRVPQMPLNPTDAHAKTMTVVTKASVLVEPAVASAGAKLREALVSVTNHAVLRGPATGQIEVPELGRVVVRAHNVAGAADVDVTADRADARIALRGHVQTMTADLRQADVPVARVTVDRAPGAFGQSTGSSPSFRDRDPQAHDPSRDNPQRVEDDAQPSPTDVGSPRRVRIVL